MGTIKLFKDEFERLKKGSEIELLLSRADPSNAMVASYFDNNKPISLAGVSATPMIYAGAGMVLIGIVVAIYGWRRGAAPAPHTRRFR